MVACGGSCVVLDLTVLQYIKGLKNKIHTVVRTNLEEILELKTFLKTSIGFKCRGPKVDLRFCSFLGCVHFRTVGTDKEK